MKKVRNFLPFCVLLFPFPKICSYTYWNYYLHLQNVDGRKDQFVASIKQQSKILSRILVKKKCVRFRIRIDADGGGWID